MREQEVKPGIAVVLLPGDVGPGYDQLQQPAIPGSQCL